MWSAFTALVAEIKKCEAARANGAALAMAFVAIDVCTAGRTKQVEEDFVRWVDIY